MEEREIRSLSENDITPEPEEPIPGEDETPPTEEGQDPAADPETPPGEEDQRPDDNTGESAQETGSGESSIPERDMQELLDGIRARFEQKDADLADLTESIRSLVDLYSTPGYTYVPPEIPIEGYREWDYPITVDYLITIVGYGEPIPQSNGYDDPDQFLEDFQAFAFECYKGDVYSEFFIDKVWGPDGKKLYDSQGMEEPEPEPGEEEPDETVELLLSHLEGISTTLEEMQQAELEYYQAVYDYHAEMKELQAHETAGTIFMLAGVVFILAALLWSELFRRFK